MGNITRRLAALDLGGHRMLLDELASSKEVMIRFPSEAVRWIDQEAPVLRLIESLVQILEELQTKNLKSPRPSTQLGHTDSGNLMLGSLTSSAIRWERNQSSTGPKVVQTEEFHRNRSITPRRMQSKEPESKDVRDDRDLPKGPTIRPTTNQPTRTERTPPRQPPRPEQRSRDGSISIDSEFAIPDNNVSFRRSNTYQYHQQVQGKRTDNYTPPRQTEAIFVARKPPETITQVSISELQKKINQKLEFATHDIATMSFDDDADKVSWRLDTDIEELAQVPQLPSIQSFSKEGKESRRKITGSEKENLHPLLQDQRLGTYSDEPSFENIMRSRMVTRPELESKDSRLGASTNRHTDEKPPLPSQQLLTRSSRNVQREWQNESNGVGRHVEAKFSRIATPNRVLASNQAVKPSNITPETDTYLETRLSTSELRPVKHQHGSTRNGSSQALTNPVSLRFTAISGEPNPETIEPETELLTQAPNRRISSGPVNPLLRLGSIGTTDQRGTLQHAESYELNQNSRCSEW